MDLPTTHYDKETPSQNKNNSEMNGMERNQPKETKKSKMDKAPIFIFLAVVFLAPLVFIPSAYVPLDVIKVSFLSIGLLISLILYVAGLYKKRKIFCLHHPLVYLGAALVVSTVISAFMSVNLEKSFFGQGFELATANFLILLFLTSFFVSQISVGNKKVIIKIYAAIFASFIVLLLFVIARFMGGASVLSFQIFNDITASLIGKWFDLGILAALVALFSFFTIKFMSFEGGWGRWQKIVLSIILVLAGCLMFVVNSKFIWSAVFIVLLGFGIYEYFTRPKTGNGILAGIWSRISVFTLVAVILALICACKGDVLSAGVSKSLKISQTELVLPWQLSLDVAADTIKESPFFGAGPNRFVNQFLRFKPLEINPSPFWGVEFSTGFGTLPTFVATMGLVGSILWLLFLIFFVRSGIKILKNSHDQSRKFLIISSFFSASFLWIMNIVYVPSHVILFLTFVLTGIFVAVSSKTQDFEEGIGMAGNSKYRMFAPVILSIIILILILWLGIVIKKTMALTMFQRGVKELNVGKSTDVAKGLFKQALFWDSSDVYYQALSEVNILKITALTQGLQDELAKNPNTQPDPEKIKEIGILIDEAMGYAKKALALDSSNYYNDMVVARISEIGVLFKIPNAYESAKKAYGDALVINPYNPQIYLNLARLEVSQNKLTEAQQYIGAALQLKRNYIEAIFLLSQIQVSNNQIKDAITSVQVATQINPNDPTLFFQLGILEYNDKNYAEAATALEKAIALNPEYANAKYFLGLSYVRLNKNTEAIAEFKDLKTTNPDNAEVDFILTNLEAGKSPFANALPPIDSKPEKRKNLPVSEEAPSQTAPSKVVPDA